MLRGNNAGHWICKNTSCTTRESKATIVIGHELMASGEEIANKKGEHSDIDIAWYMFH
jgi:hypothetical protein